MTSKSPFRPAHSQSGGVLVPFLILLVLLGAGAWWYWKQQSATKVEYQTVPVTRGDIVQAVTTTGSLNSVLNVQVGSQISGNIQKLFADWNSKVKAGQVVAQIEPSIYKASVTQAQADLANQKATLELAEINEKRAVALDKTHASPASALDQAEAALHQAQAMVQLKQGALDMANVNLEHCTIYSPIDGVVISRSVDVGQTVAASLSAPVIFTIAHDLAKMQIDSSVAEADVGNVEVGQAVDFTVDAFPYRTFHGKVVQIRDMPTISQNVVSYDVVISVSNDDLKLLPGMTANASIIIAHRTDALKVGGAALRFRLPEEAGPAAGGKPSGSGQSADVTGEHKAGGGGAHAGGGHHGAEHRQQRTVYVLRNGVPEAVQIKTGVSDGVYTEVLEGLAENDQVVIGMTGGASANAPAAMANPFGGAPRRY